MLARTVYADADSQAPALAGYVAGQRAHLAEHPLEALLESRVDWRPA
jgi:hypothetical protein